MRTIFKENAGDLVEVYYTLTLDELLSLELHDFFDYCRHQDGVPDLYIFKYLEKWSDGFKPELVKLMWNDFFPYLAAEEDDFYSDPIRIECAIERFQKNRIELPLFPDVEYTPPQRKEGMTDEQYDKICKVSKRMHDSRRGTLDVKKLLSADSVELWSLFRIKNLLKQKMGMHKMKDDGLNSQISTDIDDEFFSIRRGNDKIVIPDDEIATNKPITRDGIWFLFTTLRQKGVIRQMSDTELSELVGNLVNYSAEKLRQSKLHTQSSKNKLTSLLEDIISKIKS